MTRHLVSSVCVLALFMVPNARAVIRSGFSTNITFNVSTGEVAATWSESVERTEEGFCFPSNSLTYGWIQTKRIPVGLAWRPPSESEIVVEMKGDFAEQFVVEERSAYAYVRYGCDGVHWSTWIPMTHGYRALRSVAVSGRWIVGGLHHPPKSDKYPRSDDKPWNLFLNKVDKEKSNQAGGR